MAEIDEGAGAPVRVAEAVDFALSNGLIKLSPTGQVIHAPFTLNPHPITPDLNDSIVGLTPLFNRLVFEISRDQDFLEAALAPAAHDDPFLRRLLKISRDTRRVQPLRLGINRSDYFLQPVEGRESPRPLQVEMNTIAVSYPALSERVCLLHDFLLAGSGREDRPIPNTPIAGMVKALSETRRRLGIGGSIALIVQPGEQNLFDQRQLEFALRYRSLPVLRTTLEELGRHGFLRQGHLVLHGETISVAYLRSGYAPADYPNEEAWRGRELIEHASAVPVPGAAAQLAGAKKIQQLLAQPEVLERYCPPDAASSLAQTFAGLYDPEERIADGAENRPVWQIAREKPDRFVLKPQREGGGNNLYDDEMAQFLARSTPETRRPYIVMERLRPTPGRSLLVRDGKPHDTLAVSEIGRFGVLLADGAEIAINEDIGYLVRTKAEASLEGGVSAGYGFLDSLILQRG